MEIHMNKSQPFRLSRIFIALVATTGILVNPVFASESSQPASQYTKQQNQRYLTSLPFADRQDFDDAQRGFIASSENSRVWMFRKTLVTTACSVGAQWSRCAHCVNSTG